jgi:CheY-like chemotaxis protein
LARVDVAPGQADSPDGLKAGPHAVIRVRDTGVGMSLQVLERLFEPFFTTKVKGEGTGLGLSVVHGIVSQLQGAIKVSSVEGQGSEFVVYLPLAPSVADQQESECREATPEGAESILAVDDEQAIQALYKQTLEDLGYRVTAVGDGDEALALVGGGREAYDLVVTDLAMPGLSGLELAQALTALKPSLPVILITGTPEEFSDQQLVAAGVRRLLRKPFTKDTLARTIRSTLDAARPGPGEGLAHPS